MVSDLFGVIGQAITAFLQNLVSGAQGITALFYTPADGSTPASFTFLGTLILIGGGVALVMWLFYIVKKLAQVPVK